MDPEEKRRDRKRRKQEMEEEEKWLKEYYAKLNQRNLEELQFDKTREVNLQALMAKIKEDKEILGEVPEPQKRPILFGSRCAADSVNKTWYCDNCRRDIQPERLLLVDLPHLVCPHGCGKKAPADLEFDFCMNRLQINGHCPIGNVKDQNDKPHCVLYSTSSVAEASWRVNTVLSGQEPDADGPVFDMSDVAHRYEAIRLKHGINKSNDDKWNFETLRAMKHLFKDLGAKSLGDHPKVYRFPHVTSVKRSFRTICRMLARGFPVVTAILPGENFADLQPGQIYKCPETGSVIHAIVLIGAGRHEGVEYYHFLNSWGKFFCFAGNEDGGYGLIYADDILCTPLTFLRHESDLEDFKYCLLKGNEFPRFIPGRTSFETLPMEHRAFTLDVKLEMTIEERDLTRGLFNTFGIDDVEHFFPTSSKSSWLSYILEEFAEKNLLGCLPLLFKIALKKFNKCYYNNAHCTDDKGEGSRSSSKRFMSLMKHGKNSLLLRRFHDLNFLGSQISGGRDSSTASKICGCSCEVQSF